MVSDSEDFDGKVRFALSRMYDDFTKLEWQDCDRNTLGFLDFDNPEQSDTGKDEWDSVDARYIICHPRKRMLQRILRKNPQKIEFDKETKG